jgi:NAD(P)-dependent dehydrogenase (short-subunit alcohol dehydrogenase family)
MSRLLGKTALVTGGGSGIGLAVARAFLDEGAQVAIAGRDPHKLRRAAESLSGGERLHQQSADLADPDQAAALVHDVTARLGRIDILVNNAGMNIKERSFRELTPKVWRQMVAANLDSAFHCMLAVVPQMRQRRDGLIININSIAGKRSGPLGGLAYNAAKFGLRGLALGLAAEEKAGGLRVCTIYPGEVDTPILEQRPTPVSAEQRQHILRPEDVAAAVLFVATLPPRATVPELVLMPASATYV